jgi:hypothetical protein
LTEAERLRQGLLADAGRGDLLKTIIAIELSRTGHGGRKYRELAGDFSRYRSHPMTDPVSRAVS